MDGDEFERHRARRAALENRRTAVYRLFDADGVLLYVGISVDPVKRFRGHRYGSKRSKPKEWWPQVASSRIEWFDSRSRAEFAESFAVVTEHPRHNKAKTGEAAGRWFRHRWLEERLAGGPRPGPDAGAGAWRAWDEATAEICGHEVPFELWWSPHSPCGRLAAQRAEAARAHGRTIREHIAWPLRVEELVRLTLHHHGHCERCREPYPCAVVRSAAARFAHDPQYAPLWERPAMP
ncbi:hypothetical protein B4N89_44740 [Embleya scabrispora]|uniref:GIY-YIG domain-containing protein n=1 Tax=Embleya scabrispora TaxID=159449 RepID=A0A1T3NII7_9ACTN|nr:GIY-YIG nuclease family protein [Embleya scabrispora]OPC76602.1 hypothetical protein B4N89_44740 [Embleya scabrispora]